MAKSKREIELEALLASKDAELVDLKAQQAHGMRLKVSEFRAPGTNGPDDKGTKGGVLSVYGLGRFPVSLDKTAWIKLLDYGNEIRAFITAHEGEFRVKGQAYTKTTAPAMTKSQELAALLQETNAESVPGNGVDHSTDSADEAHV